MRPYVITLSRENSVQQAASEFKSIYIKEHGLCATPYHLELCSELVQKLKVTMDPAELAKFSREKSFYAQKLRTQALKLVPKDETPVSTTYEEMLSYGNGTLALPLSVKHYLGMEADVALASRSRPSASGHTSEPSLKSVINNFEEVQAYFEAFAHDLVPQLLESSL